MLKLVRPSGKVKPIGVTSEIFLSTLQDLEVREIVEVTDSEGATLNIARVNKITKNKSGTGTAKIIMLA
ncbi:MAG: hypothetical protein ABI904_12815 [Chloroflexota bacterium]